MNTGRIVIGSRYVPPVRRTSWVEEDSPTGPLMSPVVWGLWLGTAAGLVWIVWGLLP